MAAMPRAAPRRQPCPVSAVRRSRLAFPRTAGLRTAAPPTRFPRDARRWWLQLYRDAPVHVIVETIIIIAILYILIVKESYDPAKR